MLNSFIRTIILLICVIAALRLMGKRQIAQLQPAELVVTILLSQIAATPMQDNDIPMINTFICLLVLVGVEIMLSAVSLKNGRVRNLLQGNSVIIIRDGVIDQKAMKKLRYNLDDVLETLRQKNVFSVADVQYAVAEPNGSISILLKPEKRPVSISDMKLQAEDTGLDCAVVMDGKIISDMLEENTLTEKELLNIIKQKKLSVEDIFLLTVDKTRNITVIRKEKNG